MEAALAAFDGETVLGIDTGTVLSFAGFARALTLFRLFPESCPDTRRLQLLQFASASHAVLLRCPAPNQSFHPPPRLISLLSRSNRFKPGMAPAGEVSEIAAHFHLPSRPSGVCDVQHLARLLEANPTNLRSLSNIWLGLDIDKSQQRSAWMNAALTPEQVKYAATE
jgi:ribonuclease D